MAQVLRHLTTEQAVDPALLVGFDTGDDAAVYKLDERTALVFTADFFTPIVDDPFDWGRIAAANALSDVYAMGGRPTICLNLVGWPREVLPLELLARVLDGGASVVRDAGALVVGGHTVDDPEPKYGMAVIGMVDPARVVTNSAARAGDELFLTKPLGVGIVATALKNDAADPDIVAAAVETMTTLNGAAAEAMLDAGARAATDVTGFGFLGHLQKMLASSGVAGTVNVSRVPVMAGVRELALAGSVPGGTRRNLAHVEHHVSFDHDVADVDRIVLADAQTSGGLLISIPAVQADRLRAALDGRGVPWWRVGTVTEGEPGTIHVRAGSEERA